MKRIRDKLARIFGAPATFWEDWADILARVGRNACEGEMAEQVAVLKSDEPVRLDPDRLKELVGQLGEQEAEDVVCRAMEELAVRLSFTERQYRQGKRQDMRKSARALVSIADRIGMALLARVAGDVIACADRADEVALSAVLARLIRIGERSLTAVWDMHGMRV